MNQENTEWLFAEFPALYRGRTLPPTENLMCYGFDCGDGWFDLVYELSAQIQLYADEHPDVEVLAMQVKQKFGTLRFYVNRSLPQPHREAIVALVEQAVVKSQHTCELTGQPGVLCKRYDYYQTLCLEKAQELGYEPIDALG